MKIFHYQITFLLLIISIDAAPVDFISSNLPIVIINTDGKSIPDEPKISSTMKIIWHSDEARNYIDNTEYHYNGMIGIEKRGSSSQYYFPKKQYAVETRDDSGENLNVSLIGLPKENDWVLYAPYSDKTLMRNVLIYTLARKMGWYASRCRFCELVLNDEYMGVYVLMEKIKRDDNRVDINKLKEDEISGDDLTGGYVIKIDKFNGEHTEGWESTYPPKSGSSKTIFYQYHEPKDNEIGAEQKEYIKGKIDYFETVMTRSDFGNDNSGYPSFINIPSFIDFILLNEMAKNVDAFRLSTFLYKDKDSNDPRIYAGPIWDFNLGFGNANYYQGETPYQWVLDIFSNNIDFQQDDFQPPFWWRKLWYHENFRNQAVNRWIDLRKTILSEENIFDMIDSMSTMLEEASERNFQRWDNVLGHYVWPNPSGFANRTTYLSEVNYIKIWIENRLNWMDENIDYFDVSIDESGHETINDIYIIKSFPNPFNPTTTIQFQNPDKELVRLKIYDIHGNLVETLFDGKLDAGFHEYEFDGKNLPSGVYIYHLISGRKFLSGKTLLIK